MINRYGSKRIVTVCMLITLICTLTTPVAALNGGLLPTFFVRFILGFGGQVSNVFGPRYGSGVCSVYTLGGIEHSDNGYHVSMDPAY